MRRIIKTFGIQLALSLGAYLLLEPIWVGRLHWSESLLIILTVITVSQFVTK